MQEVPGVLRLFGDNGLVWPGFDQQTGVKLEKMAGSLFHTDVFIFDGQEIAASVAGRTASLDEFVREFTEQTVCAALVAQPQYIVLCFDVSTNPMRAQKKTPVDTHQQAASASHMMHDTKTSNGSSAVPGGASPSAMRSMYAKSQLACMQHLLDHLLAHAPLLQCTTLIISGLPQYLKLKTVSLQEPPTAHGYCYFLRLAGDGKSRQLFAPEQVLTIKSAVPLYRDRWFNAHSEAADQIKFWTMVLLFEGSHGGVPNIVVQSESMLLALELMLLLDVHSKLESHMHVSRSEMLPSSVLFVHTGVAGYNPKPPARGATSTTPDRQHPEPVSEVFALWGIVQRLQTFDKDYAGITTGTHGGAVLMLLVAYLSRAHDFVRHPFVQVNTCYDIMRGARNNFCAAPQLPPQQQLYGPAARPIGIQSLSARPGIFDVTRVCINRAPFGALMKSVMQPSQSSTIKGDLELRPHMARLALLLHMAYNSHIPGAPRLEPDSIVDLGAGRSYPRFGYELHEHPKRTSSGGMPAPATIEAAPSESHDKDERTVYESINVEDQ
jgi:hypothetical protein